MGKDNIMRLGGLSPLNELSVVLWFDVKRCGDEYALIVIENVIC